MFEFPAEAEPFSFLQKRPERLCDPPNLCEHRGIFKRGKVAGT